MRYIAAYLLLQLANPEATPSQEAIAKVVSAAGIDVDSERIGQFFTAIEGKEISQLIAEGQSKLASVPSGGAAPAAGAAAAAGGAAATEKAAEKAVEEEEESDDDMGFGLFD